MITHHKLKVVQPYFDALVDGSKTFEVRKDDRGYRVGDVLHLNEWDGEKATGRVVVRTVSLAFGGDPRFGGIEPGYVVLALAGGTSPEPTEPHNPWDASCSRNGMGEPTREGERCSICRPVDVASEPPNPPAETECGVCGGPLANCSPSWPKPKDLYEALGVTPAQQAEMRTHLAAEFERIRESERAAEAHQHHVIGGPVGEPLKPTEQEQR